MAGVAVELNGDERVLAACVGAYRRLVAINRRANRHGYDGGDAWTLDVEGAAAELAYAKHRGVYWLALADDPRQLVGDVGRAQVRSTRYRSGRLCVHETDADDAPFVLVIGEIPNFTLVGWILGRDAKREEWWGEINGNGRFAFWVPQGHLSPIGTEPAA